MIDLLVRMKSPSDFAGQQLFIQGEDWHNAMLGWTHFPWNIYAAGYKDAADALVEALDAVSGQSNGLPQSCLR